MRRIIGLTLGFVLVVAGNVEAEKLSASLRGSRASMVQQNRIAKEHGLAFYRTGQDILAAVSAGELSTLTPNEDFDVADFVRYPHLQPEGVLFVERLAAQYREACGQKLVVTSAVRPTSGQPPNAHQLSVHPAGIAVDLRVSDRTACRSWLENAILNMERAGLINGIREFRPPHYHIAIFPAQYMAYVEERVAEEEALAAEAEAEAAMAASDLASAEMINGLPAGSALLTGVDEPVEGTSESRSPVAMAVALLLVLPFGLGVLMRKRRRR